MQQVAFVPPPLPPKTRRQSSGGESTVHQNNVNAADVFGCRYPEINSNVTTTVQNHVVKIRINPQQQSVQEHHQEQQQQDQIDNNEISEPCVRISVNSSDMIQSNTMTDTTTSNYFFYGPFNLNNVISSGQVSPSDTLDSGTCSDLDITATITTTSSTPPPLPTKKKNAVSVTLIGHKRDNSVSTTGSQGDSDNDNDSNLSYDSLNSGDLPPDLNQDIHVKNTTFSNTLFPQGLLKDIRDRTVKLNQPRFEIIDNKDEVDFNHDIEEQDDDKIGDLVSKFRLETLQEVTEEQQQQQQQQQQKQQQQQQQQKRGIALIVERTYEQRDDLKNNNDNIDIDPNQFFDFHITEHLPETNDNVKFKLKGVNEETFAGYKDLLSGDGSSTIRSSKGTVRGVKNRVRNGIATFLQINSTKKSYKEKDANKVVVYTTTMGIVRETYQACMKVKQILRTLLVKYEERDVFMSGEYQAEIRDRMKCDFILVPQVFVDGQHVGDAETIERLNESGELRRILKPYKSMDVCTTCKSCGGFRLLPCPVCNGSKKSVHRNDFTTEFVALKCMNCDEVGLVKCNYC